MSASSQYSSGFGLVVYRLGRARSSPAPPSSAIRLKPVQAKPEVKLPIAEMPRSHPMKKLISVDTTSSLTIAQTPTTAIIKAYHTVPRNIKKARMIQTIRVGLRETHPNLTRFLHLEKVNDRLQSVSKSCYFPAIDEYEDDEVGGQEFHLPRDKYCDLAIVDRIHARSQPVPTIDNPNLPGIPPNRLVITSTLRGERRPAKSQVTRRKLDRFSAWKKRRHSSEHLEEYVEESVVGRPRGSKSLQMAERGSRFKEKGEASAFFKKAVKRATCILSWTKMLKNQYDSLTDQLKTFVDIARVAEELDDNKDAIRQKAGLAFNRKEFIANKELLLTTEVQRILTSPSANRTPEMILKAITCLQAVKSFAEYPLKMQEKLARVGWYHEIPPRRLILREGHDSQNCYFIISGNALVKQLLKDDATGRIQMRVVDRLRAGQSFGELSVIHKTKRNESVESESKMKLLLITRKDFLNVFISNLEGSEPSHIAYCRQVKWLKGWPVDMLNVFPREIMFHYFKRGTLIEGNSKRSKWIYIIKSGMCRVMTQLREVWPKREWRPAPALSPAPFPRQGTSEQESRLNTGFRRKSVTRAPSPIERARTEYFATLLKEQELFEREQRQKTPKKKEKPKSPSKMKTTESESESETKPAVSLPAISRIEVAKDDEGSDKTAFLPLSEAHFGTQPQPPCSAEANHVTRTSSSNRNTKAEDCFACIGELREGDAFGLQDLQFSKENVEIDETPLEVALVSQGAELIMLSKSFFLKHMDEKYQRDIRNDIQPYPERDILQYNLQTEVNWKLFREDTVQGLVDLRMYAKAPPRSNESLKIQSPCV